MAIDTWLAFVAATVVMLAIPGPTILLVIGQSLGAGSRAALPLVVGVALGDLTAITRGSSRRPEARWIVALPYLTAV